MTYRLAKRAIDLGVAGAALLLLAPLLLTLAAIIVVGSHGTPLFRQWRVGRSGHRFRMWKFRTMVSDAEQRRGELLADSREADWLHLDYDPRVTPVGRVLRRSSLDELPQLLNVLSGDMSLVGPRPLPPVENDRLPDWSVPRLAVRPGLTGLWQVRGRTQLDLPSMLQLDCEYVSALSWRTDLKILALTIPAVLTGRGAN